MANSHKTTTRADAHPPGIVSDYLPITYQGSDPAAPASGLLFYAKATGLFSINSTGTVKGPLGTGGATDFLVVEVFS